MELVHKQIDTLQGGGMEIKVIENMTLYRKAELMHLGDIAYWWFWKKSVHLQAAQRCTQNI
jgi:hypothetical protein